MSMAYCIILSIGAFVSAVAQPEITRLKLLPPGPNNPRNSEGAFIQLKDGRILLIYSHFTGNSGDDGVPGYLAGRYSSDGGKTWTEKDVTIVPSDEALMHEVMSPSLLRLQDGRIALFYVALERAAGLAAYHARVNRRGENMEQAKGLHQRCTSRILRPEQRSGGATQERRLVLPVARHDDLTKPDKFNGNPRTMCYLSDDCGKTWHQSKTVLTGKKGPGHDLEVALQEPGVVELKDGRLMMFCRTHTGYAYISFSGDHGETWSLDVPMPGIINALGGPGHQTHPQDRRPADGLGRSEYGDLLNPSLLAQADAIYRGHQPRRRQDLGKGQKHRGRRERLVLLHGRGVCGRLRSAGSCPARATFQRT